MTAEIATLEKQTHRKSERDIRATAAEAETSNTLLYTECWLAKTFSAPTKNPRSPAAPASFQEPPNITTHAVKLHIVKAATVP